VMISMRLPAWGNTPHGLFLPTPDHGVIRGNPVCRDYPPSGYDCVCAGGEDRPRQLNQLRNAAVGRGSPSPYRSSYAASTVKAENSWNFAPCSTKVPEERC
jgi:hypothetical protein